MGCRREGLERPARRPLRAEWQGLWRSGPRRAAWQRAGIVCARATRCRGKDVKNRAGRRPLSLPALLGLGALACAAATTLARAQDGAAPPAFDFSSAIASGAAMSRLHSVLVSWNGELVLEHYFNGNGPDGIENVKSVSKSLISALVGIAIEAGYIEGIDQPIADFFPEHIGDDPARQSITIGHLLSMQTGLETTSNRNFGAWVQSDDWVEFALEQPMQDRPGGRMIYSTGNTHVLSAILTQVTGQSTLEFARAHLARPLGFHLSSWPQDPNGIYRGGNDMELTPRQMLAFGRLYLNGGRVGARQIVPADWIEASWTPRVESWREEGRYYGYGWWLRDMAGFRTPYAWGYGGQFILLVPELDVVVVTTSSSLPGDDRRRHTRRIYDYVEHELIAPAAIALGEKGVEPQLRRAPSG